MQKRIAAMLMLLCVTLTLGLSACSTQFSNADILCENEPYSSYSAILRESLPAYTVETTDKNLVLYGLEYGAAIEVFDTFALPMRDAGQAEYWYPQYLSTVVIAVDRDQTDAVITRWADLPETGLPVGMSNGSSNLGLILAAISYSLEGPEYSLSAAAAILAPVSKQGNLKINDFNTPVIICLDDQAAAMIQAGRNLEIIIPAEGTLRFEKGLLSEHPLDLPDLSNALIGSGLRLLDGACDEQIYPPPTDYKRAIVLSDYTHLNVEAQNTTKVFRREIRVTRIYAAADGQEQQLTALIYIVVVIIWTGSIVRRAMQRGVRRAAVIISVLLVGWALARMLKFQLFDTMALGRYLWYSFYIFELGIPLVLLWLSSAIDKPEEEISPPKWWRYFALTSGALVILVMTNDLHQLVFRFDLSGTDWSTDYSYGPVFYAVLIALSANIVLSQVMLVKKSRHGPSKLAFLFPLGFYLLLVGYSAGYILRVPVLFENDMTIMLGIFTLLSVEVCVRIGLIPVNTKYHLFFKASPQKMQIVSHSGEMLLQAADVPQLPHEAWRKLKDHPGAPYHNGESELLYAGPISGGMVVWYEDIHIIGELSREIAESVEQLKSANAILEKSMAVGRSLTLSKARLALFSELEKGIRRHLDELEEMLRHIPEKENRTEYLARVAVLVCYVKRKCHLFFLE